MLEGRRAGVAIAIRILLVLICALPAFVGAPAGVWAQTATASAELEALLEESHRHYKAGDFARALEAGERALQATIREFGPEHDRVAVQTYGVAITAETAGRLADAERHFRETVRLRDRIHGPDTAVSGDAMQRLGGVLLRQGRIDEAERLFRRVLDIRTRLLGGDHAYNASSHADLGAVALARGRAPEALGSYREAIRLLTARTSTQTLAKSVAEGDIRRNRAAFVGLSQAAWELGRRQGESEPARLLEESYAAGQQAWTTAAGAALARMAARVGAGTSDKARRIRAMQDMTERVLALHDEDMKELAERHRLQKADAAYAAALDAFQQASFALHRETAPVAARQKELVDELQALLKRCPPGQKTAGCDGATGRRDAITRELAQLANRSSPAATGIDIMAVHKRLQAADERVPGYTAFTTARNARLAESQRLEQAIQQQRGGIEKDFPDYVDLTEPRPLTVAGTQALLRTDEAIVTILVGAEESFVWAVSRERAEWARVATGATALADSVRLVRRGLDESDADPPASSGRPGPGFDLERAHVLYRDFLAPVASVLAGKAHVIMVPTGPLTSLPFQVLLTDAPPSASSAEERLRAAPWLVRRHALSVLPSVQSLAALRKLSPGLAAPQPFLGVGDPDFSGEPRVAPKARGSASKSTPPRLAAVYRGGKPDLRALRSLAALPETADEVRAVAALLKASADAVWLGPDANERRLKQARLQDYRVLHFATHGIVAGELGGLDEPALVLTLPQTQTALDDGLLTASEVAGLQLAADWVVLSACNTASGGDAGAEALSGLARAFFYAGARSLMVSHWQVDSQAAVRLTTQTFQALADDPRLGRAEAFRRTMLAMIEAGQPPSNWAPFVIVGEGAQAR